MESTTELINNIVEKFNEITENVWIIGFSGGKDSSLLVDLAVEYVHNYRPEVKLHVIYADTMLEYPLVSRYAKNFLKELEEFAEKEDLNIKKYITKPPRRKDFLYLQLVKGYPMPHRKFRWCTEKLKIIPARRVITDIINSYGDTGNIAVLNGARLDESGHRAQLMKKRLKSVEKRCRDCIDPVSGYIRRYSVRKIKRLIGEDFTSTLPIYVTKTTSFGAPLRVYSPLAYLLEEDVWEIIRSRRKPFFTDKPLYEELLRIYGRDIQGFEGKIRFGCWLCTVATRDKSGEYFSKIIPEMEILVWARKALFLISHGANPILRKEPRFINQKYSGLNDKGIELTRAIYVVVLYKYADALSSYFEDSLHYDFINNMVKGFDKDSVITLINYVRGRVLDALRNNHEEIDPEILNVLEKLEEYVKELSIEELLRKLDDYYAGTSGSRSMRGAQRLAYK